MARGVGRWGRWGRWVVVSCRRVRRGELGGNDQVGRCRVVVYDVPRSCVVVLFLSLVARGEERASGSLVGLA